MNRIFVMSFLITFVMTFGMASAQTLTQVQVIGDSETKQITFWDSIFDSGKMIISFLSDLVVNNIVAQNITANQIFANNITAVNFTNIVINNVSEANNTQYVRGQFPIIDDQIIIPSCSAGQVLTNTTGSLSCVTSSSGRQNPSIQMGNIYFSKTMTNIGTGINQVYDGAFDPEINGMTLVNTTGYGEFLIEAIWDYVGAGTQRMYWFKHNDFTCLLHRSPTFTADQVPFDSGWQPIPSCMNNTQFVVTWYGNSTTAGDDPVAYGYNLYLR